jgi:hypothetical protein
MERIMKAEITVYLDNVRSAIDRLRKKLPNQEAYTSQIIEEYMGGFLSNIGVPAYCSWNAQFGKILKTYALTLGIKELKKAQPIRDTSGRRTKCSLWSLDNAAKTANSARTP